MKQVETHFMIVQEIIITAQIWELYLSCPVKFRGHYGLTVCQIMPIWELVPQ